MPTTTDLQERQLARAAVRALHAAIVLVHQHPDAAALHATALRACRSAVLAATGSNALVLSLHQEGVRVADEPVLATAPGDGPFAALRTAGIGELVLRAGIPDAAIAALVQRLAALRPGDDAEHCIAALVGPAGLPHVLLRAAATPGADAALAPDWAQLPDRLPSTPALRGFVERDLAANLPALAAHRLFTDLEQAPLRSELPLHNLLAGMLERGDCATAAWLLAQAEHHPQLPTGLPQRLHAAARARADDAWLLAHLRAATRDEAMALAALLMQLGPSEAARLPALADAAGHPFAPLLHELLGSG